MDARLLDHQSRNRERKQTRNGRVNRRDSGARRTTMAILFCAAQACFSTTANAAAARTAFDGSWSIAFVTRTGDCDPAYNFTVDITKGVITHPNLVKFRGRVAPSGSVHASVEVPDKYAAGSGNLSRMSGQGIWSGRSRNARCSGYWTAQRN
jgi:hypothetical protein